MNHLFHIDTQKKRSSKKAKSKYLCYQFNSTVSNWREKCKISKNFYSSDSIETLSALGKSGVGRSSLIKSSALDDQLSADVFHSPGTNLNAAKSSSDQFPIKDRVSSESLNRYYSIL